MKLSHFRKVSHLRAFFDAQKETKYIDKWFENRYNYIYLKMKACGRDFMDQEHLLWITISSYYYFYLVYYLVVDKRLFRKIRETDFRPIDEHVTMSETNAFGRGVMNGLFYFTLLVYLFLNRIHYYQARDEKGKRLHEHDFLYRYSVYVTFPLLMTRIMVYFAQDDMNNRLLKSGETRQEFKTLPTFIRNIIHHPENQNNSYTAEELKESTDLLLNILHDLA